MPSWVLDSVKISAGFLDGLDLRLPTGLTCIIGPRGTGKSTLAEAIRAGLTGVEGLDKDRQETYKNNLSRSTLTLEARFPQEGRSVTVRREGRQTPILRTGDGKVLSAVDLDRGTFLPIDGYTSLEIERIAMEIAGPKRRSLLDELKATEHLNTRTRLSSARRELDANADTIRAQDQLIADLIESIEALADARDLLRSLPEPDTSQSTQELDAAANQNQRNELETNSIEKALDTLQLLATEANGIEARYADALLRPLTDTASSNSNLAVKGIAALSSLSTLVRTTVASLNNHINDTKAVIQDVQANLAEEHRKQAAGFDELSQRNMEASDLVRKRAETLNKVRELEKYERQRADAVSLRGTLIERRKALKGDYLLIHDEISELRERVANELATECGGNVRVYVRRNADALEYQQAVVKGLQGAALQNQQTIAENLCKLPPHDLAQVIDARDLAEIASRVNLTPERAQKALDALRSNIDTLDLEILTLDDMIAIELNVGLPGEPNYKDASQLSRGQKCTALLPLLLARRDTPLVIDQPEDNLDNHFIYETIVESVRRLKAHRQMIFITHNANLPVLAEADLIVVMGSNGEQGYVESYGTLDDRKNEIIDLLEGGWKAFRLRQERYGR